MTGPIAELIERHFGSVRGQLLIGGVPIGDVVAEFGTPLFVYDGGVLDRKWRLIRSTFPEAFAISYSVKANPNPEVIRCFLALGAGLEIASGGELLAATRAGCPPDRIVFAGPGKTEAEIDLALSSGLSEIHAESLIEIERIISISRRLGKVARVALRVNPSAQTQGGAMRMGGKPAPFGVDEEQLEAVVDRILREPSVELRGIHLFMGTQILDPDVLLRQYRTGVAIAVVVSRRQGRPVATIDFGGGLGIPYFTDEREIDMDRLRAGLLEFMAEVGRDPLLEVTRFMIEPGRYLVGESGVYVARVNDVKVSRGRKFVILDGGMHHHLAASGNLGQVIKRNFPLALVNRMDKESETAVDVVGPLCTPLDVMGRDVRLPEPRVGDLVGVFQSGAYARTSSPMAFLSHPSPPEVLVKDGRAQLIRRRGTYDDWLRDVV